jgi:hypothetical protein
MKAMLRRIFLRRWWTLGLFGLALTGFGASLMVHLTSYFSDRLRSDNGIVYLLHLFCMAMCFLTFPFSRRMEKLWGRRTAFARDFGGRKGQRIIHVLFFYAIINFILFLGIAWANGHLRVWRDRQTYYAMGRMGNNREISREEYLRHGVHELRGFSGHWMLFFALPGLFFLYLRPVDLFEPQAQPEKKKSVSRGGGGGKDARL